MKEIFLTLIILVSTSRFLFSQPTQYAYIKPEYSSVSSSDDEFDDEEGSEEEQENEEIEENA
ncbi:MAG: hypothetical protein KBA66_15245 [Leptospiraceae bacterium]|nr:hypothetical protein [Leptospiraceae bacterium]